MTNSVTPSRQDDDGRAATHETWIDTLDLMAREFGEHTALGDLAKFAANILRLAGPTPELKKFLEDRSAQAMDQYDSGLLTDGD